MLIIFITLIILLNLLLASLVIIKNPKDRINRSFALSVLLVTAWIFSNYQAENPFIAGAELFWNRLTFTSASLLVPVFLYFSLSISRVNRKLNTLGFLGFSLPPLLFGFLSQTDFIVKEIQVNATGVQYTQGVGYYPFALYLLIYIALSIGILVKHYLNTVGIEKLQIRYLFFGLFLFILIATLTNLAYPLVTKDSSLSTIGPLSTIFFVVFTSFAIVKHQLWDIRLVIARTVAYSILVLTIAVSYIGSAVLLTSLIFEITTTTGQLVLYAVLSLIVAFTFQPLRKFLEHATDKIFFKEDYDATTLLSDLTKIMAGTILIDNIAHNLLKKILEQMRITRGAFVLTDGGKIFVVESHGYKEEPKFSEKDIFSLQALDKNLVFDNLEEGKTKELLRRLDITVVIPLKTQLDHIGVLLLGEKASGEIYSSKDIKVLEIFAPEAAISFENAKSVEKIRLFNITLKEQVEKATQELKNANEQLKELDRLKDEFLSIASHDLRTPMAAIKSYLWMALNGRAGEIKNDKLKRYLDISYTSSERMIALINDLLNVSRIEAGRVQMNFEETVLKPLVNQVFTEIMSKASEKSISLTYEEESKLPSVIVDKQHLTEILQNLIGNAIKFTPENGKVTVKAVRSAEEGFIEISVTDTGVGIEKEDLDKLFTKYGRLQQSYTAASTSGGTGLGLYITKNYVQLHGGKIWVTSEPGKGSTFSFTIKQANKNVLAKMKAESEKKILSTVVPQIK